MNRFKILSLSVLFFFNANASYQFMSRHYVATFENCNKRLLSDVGLLADFFLDAFEESDISVLGMRVSEFESGACSILVLLNESHAALHSYPKEGRCSIDVFTCAMDTDFEPFHKVMSDYLKPGYVKFQVMERQ